MNAREFKKHLQAIARGEEPAEREGQVLQQERERLAKKPPQKKPPAKSKQSNQKLGQVHVRRRA
jgi:hypothetical protein